MCGARAERPIRGPKQKRTTKVNDSSFPIRVRQRSGARHCAVAERRSRGGAFGECPEVRQARTRNAFELVSRFSLVGLILSAAPAHAAAELVLFPDPFWLAVLLIAFAVLVAPMNALVFKPIFRVLDERQKRIEGARRRADQLQAQADELLQRYRSMVQEVREETDRDRRQQLEAVRAESGAAAGAARAEAEGIIARSRADLESWLVGARADLRSSVEPLARVAAERVLGRGLN